MEATLAVFDLNSLESNVFRSIGEHSGRDVDKLAETDPTPIVDPFGAVYFSPASLALIAR